MAAVVDALAMEGSARVQHDEQIHAITLDGQFVFFLDGLPALGPTHDLVPLQPILLLAHAFLLNLLNHICLDFIIIITSPTLPHFRAWLFFSVSPFFTFFWLPVLCSTLCCTFAPANNLLQLIPLHRPSPTGGFKLPSHHHSACFYLAISCHFMVAVVGSR